MSSTKVLSNVRASEAEIRVYTNALARAIAQAGGPSLERLAVVYRIFASLSAPSEVRLEALWRTFERDGDLDVVDLPTASEARNGLAADLLRVSAPTADLPLTDSLQSMIQRLGLNAQQLDSIRKWIDWENDLLIAIGRGDAITPSDRYPTELAKRLSAVGIPLSTLYFSGSVIGFSAVGVTSGLASLGAASGLTALGFNPMTAGIAALVLTGVAVKSVLDVVLPPTDRINSQLDVEEIGRLQMIADGQVADDLLFLQRRVPWRTFIEGRSWWDVLTLRPLGRRRALMKLLRALLVNNARARAIAVASKGQQIPERSGDVKRPTAQYPGRAFTRVSFDSSPRRPTWHVPSWAGRWCARIRPSGAPPFYLRRF